MTRRIWKYSLPIRDEPTTIRMPKGANVIHVGNPGNARSIDLWAVHDVDNEIDNVESRVFRVFGTGTQIPDLDPPLYYIGTAKYVRADGFTTIWHVFGELAFKDWSEALDFRFDSIPGGSGPVSDSKIELHGEAPNPDPGKPE